MTTKEAAKKIGVGVNTFRKRAVALKLKPKDVEQTGKRGRPQFVWAATDVARVSKA